MSLRPRLNVTCGRCGRPREGLRHVCRSNSRRRATVRLTPAFGDCPRCGKPYGNPLTHTCRPKSGFKARKAQQQRKIRAAATAKARTADRDRQRARIAEVRERERRRSRAQVARLKAAHAARLKAARAGQSRQAPAKPRRPPHEYQSCSDTDCQRPVCVAFREGYREGDRDGYRRGYDKGFPDGIAACPRAHQ